MYELTREDGVQLQVRGPVWEAALELAFRQGWVPAGTRAPEGEWRTGHRGRGPAGWDEQDYFSHAAQHVEAGDARALALALSAALDLPAQPVPAGESRSIRENAPRRAETLTPGHRNALERLASFAGCGGFTIRGAA